MSKQYSLTEGNILSSLTRFAMPVLFALFLQALYGGIDLLIVGQFATTIDVSGVATGSMVMHTITMVVTGLSVGITVIVGQKIGEGKPQEAGKAIGSGICFFGIVTAVLTVLIVFGSDAIATFMHAPKDAFEETSSYILICGMGSVFFVAYNVIGSIFRGLGDSKTPLITVAIACVFNIAGDLLLVAVFGMGARGAALATVLSQATSVLISLLVIKTRQQPFDFSKDYICFNKSLITTEFKLGFPVALQELLVGLSFLVIQMIVNSIGVTASAGVGVAEKLCTFVMLVPSAYAQSMTAFVAQNAGAGKPERASKGLFYGIATSVAVGVVVGYTAFFHGDILSSIFTADAEVILSSHSYLKAYAIDCVLTPFLFCFIGYYNGYGRTLFVMVQGLVGAFCVRIPVAFFVSRIPDATLFHIGLATPSSTVIQIILCLYMLHRLKKKGFYSAFLQ
ncbi:MAG: MATE family efflux transporter [Bacillota bacterium]|nr:MATE family efflux transporter [Bacillota bacterium]